MNHCRDNAIKLNFEENGKNYLIYRLQYCEKGMEQSVEFWHNVKIKFWEISEFLKNYSAVEFKSEDWDDFKKIKKSYSSYQERYSEEVQQKLELVVSQFELDKYKDIGLEVRGLKTLIKNEMDSMWKKVQYGTGVKDYIQSAHSVIILKINKIESVISARLGLYKQFQEKYEKSLLLLTKVYINDLKEKDYEIVFSFENNVSPELSIFLYQEVYRLLKDEIIPAAESEIAQLQVECCELFAYLKEAPVHKFLCRLDQVFVKINTVTANRILFNEFSSLELNTFIDRFRTVEKLFSSKLVETKKVSEQFYSEADFFDVTQSDFSLLVMWELLSLNCAQLLTLKNNPDWHNKIVEICFDLYSKLKHESLESLMMNSPVKIIPWQTLAAVNPKYADKFLDAWKEQFLKKQYPSLDNSKGFLLTGKKYVDDDGEYQESVCIYLCGIQEQSFFVDKRSSLEKTPMIVQQKGMAMSSNSSIKIGVQLAVMVDRCILSSKNTERFAS